MNIITKMINKFMYENNVYKLILTMLGLIVVAEGANADFKNNTTNCEGNRGPYIIDCSNINKKNFDDNFSEYLTPKFGAYISSTSGTMSVVVISPFFI